jgi:polyhydroxyalkanoate synthase
MEDHIAPWKSTCSGARLFSGDVRFMLGGSGHIAGIINPPAAGKYSYRVTDRLPEDVETWAAEAEVVDGSWWPAWDRWVKALADDQVAARQPGDHGMPIIEDAPGSYVKRTLNDISQTDAPVASTADERNEAAVPASEPVIADSSQPAPADDLTAIKGIGPKLADVLTNSGIVSYAQLAELGSDGIREHLLSVDERYARYDTTSWPEQARMLMP